MTDNRTARRSSKDRIKARMSTLNGLFVFQSILRGDYDEKNAHVDKSVYDDCNDKLAYVESMKRFHGKK